MSTWTWSKCIKMLLRNVWHKTKATEHFFYVVVAVQISFYIQVHFLKHFHFIYLLLCVLCKVQVKCAPPFFSLSSGELFLCNRHKWYEILYAHSYFLSLTHWRIIEIMRFENWRKLQFIFVSFLTGWNAPFWIWGCHVT